MGSGGRGEEPLDLARSERQHFAGEVRKHRGGVGAPVSSASDANSPARLPRPTTPGLPPRRPPRHQPASTADHVPRQMACTRDPLRHPTTGFLGTWVVALMCLSDDGVSILRWR